MAGADRNAARNGSLETASIPRETKNLSRGPQLASSFSAPASKLHREPRRVQNGTFWNFSLPEVPITIEN